MWISWFTVLPRTSTEHLLVKLEKPCPAFIGLRGPADADQSTYEQGYLCVRGSNSEQPIELHAFAFALASHNAGYISPAGAFTDARLSELSRFLS